MSPASQGYSLLQASTDYHVRIQDINCAQRASLDLSPQATVPSRYSSGPTATAGPQKIGFVTTKEPTRPHRLSFASEFRLGLARQPWPFKGSHNKAIMGLSCDCLDTDNRSTKNYAHDRQPGAPVSHSCEQDVVLDGASRSSSDIGSENSSFPPYGGVGTKSAPSYIGKNFGYFTLA
ncbi:hypothetical protein GQ44DRAFT_787641 [Phaeosphaeriaceae sp. PMI808]|nr:hypothetical protein GQ44DRAFT_787641 [Phaeosphaeriaceae sp. PMI808]